MQIFGLVVYQSMVETTGLTNSPLFENSSLRSGQQAAAWCLQLFAFYPLQWSLRHKLGTINKIVVTYLQTIIRRTTIEKPIHLRFGHFDRFGCSGPLVPRSVVMSYRLGALLATLLRCPYQLEKLGWQID